MGLKEPIRADTTATSRARKSSEPAGARPAPGPDLPGRSQVVLSFDFNLTESGRFPSSILPGVRDKFECIAPGFCALESCRRSLSLRLLRLACQHVPPRKKSALAILGFHIRGIHVVRDVRILDYLVDGVLVHEDLRRNDHLLRVAGEGRPLQNPELPPFRGQQLLAAVRELCSEDLDGLLVPDVNDLAIVQHFG